MQKKKQYISTVFLVFFIFIKTAGIHSITHANDDLNSLDCDICEFVETSNNTPFTSVSQTSFEQPHQQSYYSKTVHTYTFQYVQNTVNTALFGRPPPVV
jgi:hypothetical protein